MFGTAVKNACEILLKRLEPIIEQNPKGIWEDWIQAAYYSCISLSTSAFAVPESASEIQVGKPRSYMAGTACTVVEVDCLTGDHHIISTDIVMNLADTLNPAIDIGQLEGGFVQGYGLYTWEDLRYSNDGHLVNNNMTKYKIPSVATVPRHFKTVLIKRDEEKYGIYSSRGIGESGFYLGSSAYFAICNAVNAYRKDNGLGPCDINSPATPARIRLACEDRFTKAVE